MKETPVKIELLAPAKNLETAIDAVNHGADAVYIGAPRFGARQAAGNSVEDIAELVEYAHIYGVKVYVTLNTIIYDDEIVLSEISVDDKSKYNETIYEMNKVSKVLIISSLVIPFIWPSW